MPVTESKNHTPGTIFDRNIDAAYRICYTFLKNRNEIGSVVSRVMLERMNAKVRFHDEKEEAAWIITTAELLCREYLREERRQLDEGILEEVDYSADRNLRNPVISAIHSLPRDLKSIVYMYYHEGFSTMEIAKFLKLRPATVRSRLSESRMDLNMTRQNVRKAYESVVLADEEKQTLRQQCLEGYLNGEPAGENAAAQVSSKRNVYTLLTAAVALIVICGAAFSMQSRKPVRTVPEQPMINTVTTIPAVQMPAQYREILSSVILAVNQNWTPEQYHESGISYMYALQGDLSKIGYSTMDLDGNGTEELILTDGNVIFDLFTMVAGETAHVLTGSERNSYRLC